MCGIAGEFSFQSPVTKDITAQIVQRLMHRGPDNQVCCKVNRNLVFGHTRLAIIETSNQGVQPFKDDACGVTVTFNGEIYNYLELRESLSKKGHSFVTKTDTEVLIKSFREWGIRCFDKFNGMFAVAIYDHFEHRLYLARDRFGKKPLFYVLNKEKLIFSSELLPLTFIEERKYSQLNHSAIRQYLSLNYNCNQNQIVAKVNSLEPATVYIFESNGHLAKTIYWDYSKFFETKKTNESLDQLNDELSHLLSDSCKIRLRSDVPVGLFLSGGIDSSLIAAHLASQDYKIPALTAKFANRQFDESEHAKKVANFFGCNISGVTADPLDGDALCNIIKSLDTPLADTSVFPLHQLCREASENFRVMLTGDGGDEIFAGYETYGADELLRYFSFVPSRIMNMGGHAFAKFTKPSFSKVGLDEKIRRFLVGADSDPMRAHLNWRQIFSNNQLTELLQPDFHHLIESDDPFNTYKWHFEKVSHLSHLDRALYADSKTWLLDDILVKSDRVSMLSSIELRSPFLDYRIAEKVAGIQTKFKATIFERKKILKHQLSTIVPDKRLARGKKGFNAPVNEWVNKILNEALIQLTRDKDWQLIINMDYVRALIVQNNKRQNNYALELYGLAVLYLWSDYNGLKI